MLGAIQSQISYVGYSATLAFMSPPGGSGQSSGNQQMQLTGFMIIFMAIMWFMIFLPQKRKEKERKALIASVKSGDRVVFSGGIIGAVTNVKESTLIVKIADKTKIEILRGAVLRVVEKGEEITESSD